MNRHLLLFAILLLFCSDAFAQSPVSCDGSIYHSRYNPGTNSTRIYRLTASPYAETLFATAPNDVRFNALAYDAVDSILYGISSTQRLLQIDNAGIIRDLGAISNLPNLNWVGGTFDGDASYWVLPESGNTLYKIDIFTQSAISIPLPLTITQVGDLAWDTITNTILVTTLDSRLYKIDAITRNINLVLLSPSAFETNFIDGAGNFFGYDPNGALVKIDTVSGAVTPVSNGTTHSQGDGASCPYYVAVARPIINLAQTVNYLNFPSPGTDLTYTTKFSNNGTRPAYAFVMTQSVAEFTDFKLGSVYIAGPPGVQFEIVYSNNFNRRNSDRHAAATAATWTYQPVSRGGSAEADYDRRVKAIQIRTTQTITMTPPMNEGFLQYKAKIQ